MTYRISSGKNAPLKDFDTFGISRASLPSKWTTKLAGSTTLARASSMTVAIMLVGFTAFANFFPQQREGEKARQESTTMIMVEGQLAAANAQNVEDRQFESTIPAKQAAVTPEWSISKIRRPVTANTRAPSLTFGGRASGHNPYARASSTRRLPYIEYSADQFAAQLSQEILAVRPSLSGTVVCELTSKATATCSGLGEDHDRFIATVVQTRLAAQVEAEPSALQITSIEIVL